MYLSATGGVCSCVAVLGLTKFSESSSFQNTFFRIYSVALPCKMNSSKELPDIREAASRYADNKSHMFLLKTLPVLGSCYWLINCLAVQHVFRVTFSCFLATLYFKKNNFFFCNERI